MELLDFGPQFRATGGIQSTLPPVSRKRYEQFVPRPGEDGPAAAGIDTLWTRAALGTNVGWNLRPPGIRSKDLCYLSGAYLPFAKTKAERLASSDPRRSLEERYQDHAGFVRAVDKATRELVEGRFLLPADASVLNKAAVDSDVLK